jgi:hypothetical protein
VAIHVEGECGLRVPEPRRDDLGIYTVSQELGHMAMAKVMEGDVADLPPTE